MKSADNWPENAVLFADKTVIPVSVRRDNNWIHYSVITFIEKRENGIKRGDGGREVIFKRALHQINARRTSELACKRN